MNETTNTKRNKILFSVEDASEILNLKVSRIRKAVFSKEITYIKFQGLIRFRLEDLMKYIESNVIHSEL